jgi:glycosyltransferase involved in cell wall biosynthesis
MKILHVVAGLWEENGGPSEVIPNLCSSLQQEGCEITIATISGKNSMAVDHAINCGVEVLNFDETGCSPIRFSLGLMSYLEKNIKNFDVVHNHGQWLFPNWITWWKAKKNDVPMVTTPHGTLVKGMLKKSTFKKMISWFFFDKNIISYSRKVHALSDAELIGMLPKISVGLEKTVVIPNGTYFHEDKKLIPVIMEALPKEKKNLLYLSRIHPIKGIFDLLEVWQELSLSNESWQLIIVGPCEPSIETKLMKIVGDLHSTYYLGPVYGDVKFDILHCSDAFILPSYAEGLPTALLEAASCKLPILCTEECNFPKLKDHGGSVEYAAGKDNLKAAMESFLSIKDASLKKMGGLAHEYMNENFSWESIAKQWIKVYRDTKGADSNV